MHLILLLLLAILPANATSSSPLDDLNGDEICSLVDLELKEAVKFDLITQDDANSIILRCLINYS